MDDAKNIILRRWLAKAEEDLRSAKNDLKDEPPITATACFHAQQCAEKSLKAFLVFVDKHIDRTHSLTYLVDICSDYDLEFQELEDLTGELTQYAIETRYPDDWREISVKEAFEAVENAEKVFNFVKRKLKR